MKHLISANARLKGVKCRLRIEIKDQGRGTLNLRGQLPPKDGQGQWTRQRIYLGLPANPSGVAQAEKMARKISADLDVGQFSWDDYLTPKGEAQDLEEAIERFHQDYLAKGGKQANWTNRYLPPLDKLSQLTPHALVQVVKSTEPDSRSRQIYYDVVNRFAKFLKLSLDLEGLRGSYKPKPRDIPTDAEIFQRLEQISNPSWKWVYCMMATYGLRNHEVFRIEVFNFPSLMVMEETKTGRRNCYPCLEQWIDQWELQDVNLPKVNLEQTNKALGLRVSRQFQRYGLPFSPYALRHAFAIRTIREGWPPVLASRSMGHSLATHNRQYHRWITDQQDQEIYQRLNQRNTPTP